MSSPDALGDTGAPPDATPAAGGHGPPQPYTTTSCPSQPIVIHVPPPAAPPLGCCSTEGSPSWAGAAARPRSSIVARVSPETMGGILSFFCGTGDTLTAFAAADDVFHVIAASPAVASFLLLAGRKHCARFNLGFHGSLALATLAAADLARAPPVSGFGSKGRRCSKPAWSRLPASSVEFGGEGLLPCLPPKIMKTTPLRSTSRQRSPPPSRITHDLCAYLPTSALRALPMLDSSPTPPDVGITLRIVDSTAGCDRLSFLDAYSGYNQIKLKKEDQELTAFITPHGVFCYNVMNFGLKNAWATYQRCMQACLGEQIGRNIEVYIDDIVVKTKHTTTLIDDLRETFDNLDKYQIKLNPKKCFFGVPGGQVLGYCISARGIEANPLKIKAILDMEPPKNLHQVQQLAGRLAALSRFIAKLGEKGCELKHIGRASNEEADSLANIGSMCSPIPDGVFYEVITQRSIKEKASAPPRPSADESEASPQQAAEESPPPLAEQVLLLEPLWTKPFLAYLTKQELPEDPVEARRIVRRSKAFTVVNGELYKCSISGIFQRCIAIDDGKALLREIHEGTCGHHAGSRALVAKAFRAGFYWPTAASDARDLVMKCSPCQRFSPKPHAPATDMMTIPLAWPFAQWRLDQVGPLPRSSPGGHTYLLVAVDKFTKWIEAVPVRNQKAETAVQFFRGITCRFGMPHSIVTDTDLTLTPKSFENFVMTEESN
ncbi:hypothetical protein QYE76_059044 [Lolium multiflorum]|uniref:Integrase catalytic domain-containing protein n=1 Tax=Lolium multiflorum TaxID=4521 RepID=A0AAD8WSZ4_LOLMU|nr:hypothetical protein QYE76_059044 [Lolium multiflorum]